MRKDPHTCTIGWNIDSNKPHASPGLYNSNAFVVIKASPISSQKSHIVLNKPHASLFGHCIEMNKPSVRNKAIGCYIPQSRVQWCTIVKYLVYFLFSHFCLWKSVWCYKKRPCFWWTHEPKPISFHLLTDCSQSNTYDISFLWFHWGWGFFFISKSHIYDVQTIPYSRVFTF